MADIGPPKHEDIFADIGKDTSLGDDPLFSKGHVEGRDRDEFKAFGFGRNKTNALSMKAALAGRTPTVAEDKSVTWNALDKREEVGSRTFRKPDDTGFKEITQKRARSGSIIETHNHLDKEGGLLESGSVLHQDRTGRIQYLNKARIGDMAKPFPSKIESGGK